jgi:rhodanese-related sulfurtransferase
MSRSAADHAGVADGVVRGANELLAAARARITRFEPLAAWEAASTGAVVVVDIRSDDDRRSLGVVPGSLHIPRTVLEWRVDPASGWSNPHVAARDRRLVLMCSHGLSSSLAAAVLLDLGFEGAADVAGGFEAWLGAGLPVRPAPTRAAGVLPGMTGPD